MLELYASIGGTVDDVAAAFADALVDAMPSVKVSWPVRDLSWVQDVLVSAGQVLLSGLAFGTVVGIGVHVVLENASGCFWVLSVALCLAFLWM